MKYYRIDQPQPGSQQTATELESLDEVSDGVLIYLPEAVVLVSREFIDFYAGMFSALDGNYED